MRAELGRARPFSSVVAANGHEISDETQSPPATGDRLYDALSDAHKHHGHTLAQQQQDRQLPQQDRKLQHIG
jgi:hypothetical protein